MSFIWPYAPMDVMTERLQWLTDVLQARSAEQRICMREIPRRAFSMSHMMSAARYSEAQQTVREEEDFLIPHWGQIAAVGAVASGTLVTVNGCFDVTELAIGSQVVVWGSDTAYEQAEVTAINATTAELDAVSGTYASALVMPLLNGKMLGGIEAQRDNSPWRIVSVDFQINDNLDDPATGYSQYLSIDVLTDVPVIGAGGSFSESIKFPAQTFDNQTSNPEHIRLRTLPENTFFISWQKQDMAEMYVLIQWLHSRRGRQKAFWVSSFAGDLTVAGNITGTTLPVADFSRTDFPVDVDILGIDGTHYYRRVTAATPSGGNVNLTMSTTLSLTAANTEKISFLRCARLDSDNIDITHTPGRGALQVVCMEIPTP